MSTKTLLNFIKNPTWICVQIEQTTAKLKQTTHKKCDIPMDYHIMREKEHF